MSFVVSTISLRDVDHAARAIKAGVGRIFAAGSQGSGSSFVKYFVENEQLSEQEIEELLEIIQSQH